MKLISLAEIESHKYLMLKIAAISTTIAAASIIALLFYKLRNVFVLFVISGLLAYVLNPIVEFFEQRGVRRTLGVSLIFTTFMLFLSLFGMILGPILIDQLSQLQYDIPKLNNYIKHLPDQIESWITASMPQLKDTQIAKHIQDFSDKYDLKSNFIPLLPRMFSVINSMFAVFSMMVVVPFLTFFFLSDWRKMKKSLVKSIPNKYYEMILTLIHEFDRQVGMYIRGRVAETIIVFIISVIAFFICGLPYYIPLGVISGVSIQVPYVGTVVTGMVAVVLAIPKYHLMAIPIVMGTIIFIHLIDNFLLSPLVVGKSVDLDPITTIFVLFVGGELLGLLGLLISVPIASMVKAAIEIIYKELKEPPDALT